MDIDAFRKLLAENSQVAGWIIGGLLCLFLLNRISSKVNGRVKGCMVKTVGTLIVIAGIIFAIIYFVPAVRKYLPFFNNIHKKADYVILFYGTWNNTDYSLLETQLSSATINIPYQEFRGSDSGERQKNSTELARIALLKLNDIPELQQGTMVVDIVGHSFGGLVARRFAQLYQNQEERLNLKFRIRNIITCGTPLGGLEAILSERNDGQFSVPPEMNMNWMKVNRNMYTNVPGVTYWMLGGTTATGMRQYSLAIDAFEEPPTDGIVSTRSIAGPDYMPSTKGFFRKRVVPKAPKSNDYMIFLPVNHAEFLSKPEVLNKYIVPVIEGKLE